MKTHMWHFTDPRTNTTIACHRDERWEAEEAFLNHLQKSGVEWDKDANGDLGDWVQDKGIHREGDCWSV